MKIFLFLIAFEVLHYDLYFGHVRAGSGYLKIEEAGSDKGLPLLKASLVTRTEGFWKKVYPVYDSLVSTFRSDTYTTVKYERYISEGKYREISFAEYKEDTVYYSDGKKVPISGPSMDPIAVLYFLRSKSLSDSNIVINYHVDKFTARIKVKASITKWGSEKAVRVYLDFRDKNVAKTPGEIIYYYEIDGERRPLELSFKTNYGILKARLKKSIKF